MLTKMFTVTAAEDQDGDSACALFFHKDGEDVTEEEINAIAKDPLCRSLMGDYGVMTCDRYEKDDYSEILVSREVRDLVVPRLEKAQPEDTVILFTPNNEPERIRLQDVYYGCKLPRRAIIGCDNCFESETKTNCVFKDCWEPMENADVDVTVADAIQSLKNRKSMIAGFTYLSPMLTRDTHFVSPYRHHTNHCFSCVEENSSIARQGLKERGRLRRFRENACSKCLVREACHHTAEGRYIKLCKGPYVDTEKEANATVVKNAKVPFTNKQLLFLALNSGELDARYNRRIYWATFRYTSHGLTFGLCRKTTGKFERIETFEEAEKIIRQCNNVVFEVKNFKALTLQQKAVLIELARAHYSPVQRGRWHRTQYEALGIEYSQWNNSWTLYFKFNSSGSSYAYRPYGMRLTWDINAKTLEDVFREYLNLESLEKTSHEDSYRRIHNSWY